MRQRWFLDAASTAREHTPKRRWRLDVSSSRPWQQRPPSPPRPATIFLHGAPPPAARRAYGWRRHRDAEMNPHGATATTRYAVWNPLARHRRDSSLPRRCGSAAGLGGRSHTSRCLGRETTSSRVATAIYNRLLTWSPTLLLGAVLAMIFLETRNFCAS